MFSRACPADGILLVGHGTRDPQGIACFHQTAKLFRQHAVQHGLAGPIAFSFLELAEPSIADGFRQLARAGARRVLVVPVLLFAAGHAKVDIPGEVSAASQQVGLQVTGQTQPLEWQSSLLELSALRFQHALDQPGQGQPGQDQPGQDQPGQDQPGGSEIGLEGFGQAQLSWSERTLWLLVGRGSRDENAATNLAEFARRRARLIRTDETALGFCALTEPPLETALATAGASDASTVVVQPHFLFPGLLPRRVCETVKEYAVQAKHQRWVLTDLLGPHPLLAEALWGRVCQCSQEELPAGELPAGELSAGELPAERVATREEPSQTESGKPQP